MARSSALKIATPSNEETVINDSHKVSPKVNETAATSADIVSISGILIEENIPLPESNRSGDRKSKYPWLSLQVGNSFFVKDGKLSTFNTLCYNQKKKFEGKPENERKAFVARDFVQNNGDVGVRVWRTA